ncbi:PucR family transcriptional regulator [Conexibacter woesei]|uniref:Transcriptional regulator, PucR family n=1 Tax=Conexibacter woesei (strain DSM 14684 / CCUG 47730 / CIP 108061 / JCM 11494 / NBRC 100937 / ID131577) TaxID=469383 RepID=D3EZD6_CONWI|nr:PucR family transcriptional regulator [Conexibacter woesei]ADB51901.1 transcriptional regulator, PucR family [Conexibacter woesei DSM 14684]
MAAASSPSPGDLPPRITVAQALALPAVQQGLPVVVAGERNLDRPIRWVHAGEVSYIASVLLGGELLLTTGMGIGRRPAEQRRFVQELDEAGAAALCVELGGALDDLPPALVREAEQRGLPLVAFRRDVRFIPVTEAIHTELVNSRYAVLQRCDEIHRRLTEVVLDGEGIPEVLRVLAETLATPVVLEGARGRVLAHAVPAGDARGEDALDAWASTRGRDAAGGAPWRAGIAAPVPLGRGAPGRLVVLPVTDPLDELARLVLDRAAGLVALSLQRSRQEEELLARERGSFLLSLSGGRIATAAARRQAELIGFAPASGLLLGLAAETAAPVEPAEWSLVLRDAQVELEGRGAAALVGQREHPGQLLALVALHEQAERDATAALAAAALRTAATRRIGGAELVVAVGRAAGWDAIGSELRFAAEGAASAGPLPAAAWYDARTLELQRLLWRWREDRELAALVQRRLGPLVAHDRRRRHQLLPTLEALCAHGGHKAETARALHLNRQALYHRLDRIEQLLGADLSDAQELLTLHLAVEARRYVERD